MRGNEHSAERAGAWRVEGLDGAARALVEGDRDAARRAALETSERGQRIRGA